MLFWGREEFAGAAGQGATIDPAEAKRNLEAVLARARPKELAHDYLEGGWAAPPLSDAVRERVDRPAEPETRTAIDEKLSVEELQRQARENWLALKAQQPDSSLSIEEQRRRARERWREFQQSKSTDAKPGQEAGHEKDQSQEREKPLDRGIDDDLSL